MIRPMQLRIVLVGGELLIRPLEDALIRSGATNYICVPSLDAAEWLEHEGLAADVLIVHDLIARRPHAFAGLVRAGCEAVIVMSSGATLEKDVRQGMMLAMHHRIRRLQGSKATNRRWVLPAGQNLSYPASVAGSA